MAAILLMYVAANIVVLGCLLIAGAELLRAYTAVLNV